MGRYYLLLTVKKNVNQLAVIVSGSGDMKLLGVPKVPNWTGEAQATAVFQLIGDWHLSDRIRFMCFDTMSNNIGNKACILLQQKLEKPLISLACRHHVHELLNSFSLLMACSNRPTIKLFDRFSQAWNYIDRSSPEISVKHHCCSHPRTTKRKPYPLLSSPATRIPAERWLQGIATVGFGFSRWLAKRYSH